MRGPGVLTAEDMHCLVIPDGYLGLPVIAALEQDITVIAVRENSNRMSNNLSVLPWRSGQFFRVENYWEAAGVIAALRAGITPDSVRRPLAVTRVVEPACKAQRPACGLAFIVVRAARRGAEYPGTGSEAQRDLRTRRLGQEGGKHDSYHRAVDRGAHRYAHLVGNLRPRIS